MILSIGTGYGLIEISRLFFKFISYIFHIPFLIILFIIPLFLFKINYFHNDKSNYYFSYDYIINILNHIEPQAIIFLKGDSILFPYWYLHYIEERRKDLIGFSPSFCKDFYLEGIIRRYPKIKINFPLINFTPEMLIKEIISQNIDIYPIYALNDEVLPTGFSMVPCGIFQRIIRNKDENLFIQNIKKVKFIIRGLKNKRRYEKDLKVKNEIILNYAISYNNLGLFYFKKGKNMFAIREFKKAIEINLEDAAYHSN